MKTIPLTPETEALVRRVVWFEEPAEALSDTVRFVAHALARATDEDMKVLRDFLADDDLREALDDAPGHHRPALMGVLELQAGALSRAPATGAEVG
jgi:hypothetical protein